MQAFFPRLHGMTGACDPPLPTAGPSAGALFWIAPVPGAASSFFVAVAVLAACAVWTGRSAVRSESQPSRRCPTCHPELGLPSFLC